MSSDAAKTMPERGSGSESVRAAATASPTESEIAAVAYRLWQDNGCPVGSDREDWFRAKAMLKNAVVAKCEYRSKRPSIPGRDTRAESETLEFASKGWQGHWEVWERECVGARWVWNPPGKAVYARIFASADGYSPSGESHYGVSGIYPIE
jgi:hypothetical protein